MQKLFEKLYQNSLKMVGFKLPTDGGWFNWRQAGPEFTDGFSKLQHGQPPIIETMAPWQDGRAFEPTKCF